MKTGIALFCTAILLGQFGLAAAQDDIDSQVDRSETRGQTLETESDELQMIISEVELKPGRTTLVHELQTVQESADTRREDIESRSDEIQENQ